jgi:hypothetical protein
MWTRCGTREGASTTQWRPTWRRKRVLLRLQDQCNLKLKPMMYMDSYLDVLYMDGKITISPFQRYQSYLHVRPESLEMDETSQSPETILMLQHCMGPLGLVLS